MPVGQTGDVAAGSGKARDDAAADRIGMYRHDDRHTRLRVFHMQDRWRAIDDHHRRCTVQQLGSELRYFASIIGRMPLLEHEALTLNVAKFAHSLPERRHPVAVGFWLSHR